MFARNLDAWRVSTAVDPKEFINALVIALYAD